MTKPYLHVLNRLNFDEIVEDTKCYIDSFFEIFWGYYKQIPCIIYKTKLENFSFIRKITSLTS